MNRHIASIAIVSFAALTVGVGGAIAQVHDQSACGRFSFDREACLGDETGSGSGTAARNTTGTATGSSSVSTDETTQFPSASPPMSDDKGQRGHRDRDQVNHQDTARPHGSRE
jgi:hypothetical protein